MPIAVSSLAFNPLPPIRAAIHPASITSSIFFSCSPCSSAFVNRGKLLLRSRGTRPPFGTVVRCGGAVREIDELQFSDVVLKSERPVLVEFVATWCGPCRLIAPAVQQLAQEYEDKLTVVKIDHDLNPRLIEEYKVYGLPTLILFQNGLEVPESRREGAITKMKLKEYVDKFLESVSVA